MDLGLSGKTALITGGTSGIGLAVARRLLDEGSRVAICGRDRKKLEAAVATLASREVTGLVGEVRNPADIASLIDDVIGDLGGIDIVVSNAGTHIAGRFDEVPTDDLVQHFNTKVVGPWVLARRVAPHMRARGGGRFIVIIGQTGKV